MCRLLSKPKVRYGVLDPSHYLFEINDHEQKSKYRLPHFHPTQNALHIAIFFRFVDRRNLRKTLYMWQENKALSIMNEAEVYVLCYMKKGLKWTLGRYCE